MAPAEQKSTDASDQDYKGKAQDLSPTLGSYLLGNDVRFDRTPMIRLFFCQRHDPIRTTREDALVSL